MKNFLAVLLAACLFQISACNKPKDNDEFCEEVVSFATQTEDVNLVLQVYNGGHTSYEVEYGAAGFKLGSGTKKTVLATNPVIENLAYGTYDIYMRLLCADGKLYTRWSSAVQFVIDGTTTNCTEPTNLSASLTSSEARLSWSSYQNGFYDVQYGPTGFKLGDGEIIRTNSTYTIDAALKANTTYDFYVRGNCGGNKFSKWAGPQSFFSSKDYNQGLVPCNTPTNLYAYRVNSMEINFQFTASGALSYEYSFTASSTSPGSINSTVNTSGTVAISTGSSSVSYFWVRAKCLNGSFTSWDKVAIQ